MEEEYLKIMEEQYWKPTEVYLKKKMLVEIIREALEECRRNECLNRKLVEEDLLFWPTTYEENWMAMEEGLKTMEERWKAVKEYRTIIRGILFLYLFAYVGRGSTKTYNSGALEFRDLYVSVLLFHGSYVWIKFRDVSTSKRSHSLKGGTKTVRYEGYFKVPGGKEYAGTYENREDAKVGARIAEFYSGRNTKGKVDLQDGFSFDIPPVAESERFKLSEVSSLSDEQASKYKRDWVKVKTPEVFKMYKEQKARWIASLIDDLLDTLPLPEHMNQQLNVQEGQPGGPARIAEEQQQHYQNLPPLIENLLEEQLGAGLHRIVEDQQQRNLLQQAEERYMESERKNLELERKNLEVERKNLELERKNWELERKKIERREQQDLENLGWNT